MNTIPSVFFCGTPYQIITAIAISRMIGEEADLFIIPYFKNAERYAENIKKLNLFRRVKVVEEGIVDSKYKSRTAIHFEIIKNYLKLDDIARTVLYDDTCYERMFVSSKAVITRIVYLYYLKHNIKTDLIHYDDGEGSYDFRLRVEPTIMDKLARLLLVGPKSLKNTDAKTYLYKPDLYRKLNMTQDNELIAIQHDYLDTSFRHIMAEIFEIDLMDLIDESVVIIDMLKEAKYGELEIKRINNIYESIQAFFGPENTIIKRHPRDSSKYNLSIKCFENDSIPFECLCTQMDMNNKVLIGLYSTALIIPKLLLNQEPTVILMYRLFERLEQSTEARIKQDMFYESFKESYTADHKFFIPETIDELNEALTIASANISGRQ